MRNGTCVNSDLPKCRLREVSYFSSSRVVIFFSRAFRLTDWSRRKKREGLLVANIDDPMTRANCVSLANQSVRVPVFLGIARFGEFARGPTL